MKRYFVLFTLVAALFVLIPTVQAQLLMEHSRVRKTLKPGETVVDSMALINRSSQPMELTIYWEDFEYIEPFDGKKEFFPAGSSSYSMTEWISFSPREVTIPPGAKIDVNYTIKVPQHASGGRYGILFFESGLRRKAETTGVSIITRVGSIFFIEMTDKDKTSAIEDIHLDGQKIIGIIENKGNVILFPRGIYYVMDDEGLVVERDELAKIYLPPQKEAEFSIALSSSLKAGQYTLVLTFDLEEGASVVKEIDFAKNADASFEILQLRD